jgi:predicted permease
MYLFDEFQSIPWFLLILLWGFGGWLITLRWFDLEPHERGFIVLKTVKGAKLSHCEFVPDFRQLADISGCK